MKLTSRGRNYYLTRKGDQFWVDTVDPAAEMRSFIELSGVADPARLPRVQKQIVMTTGSHHHQTYWMQNANGTLLQFPWVYHIDTHRWVYRIDSFLRPPSESVTFNIWNMTCIACHSTGGEPRIDPVEKAMHSVGEPGISCEACHGPGRQHVTLARSGAGSPARLRDTITHPGKLDATAASQVCGQCHVIAGRNNERQFLSHGDPYRAGGDQFETLREVVREMEDTVHQQEHSESSIKTGFWPDGTVRTGGREYNGLIRSKCHTEGTGARQMSCLSCHSMHSYESTNKLMAKSTHGDTQCIQCHDQPQYTSDVGSHSHHAADSAGSRCVNCHMPHTSYALFSAIRSHRIQSPSLRTTSAGGRPNACNLCHLDQSKRWTAAKLKEWYDITSDPSAENESELAAGVVWALRGDAAQRAVAAWHLGWSPATMVSGGQWTIPILADMLQDPYSAVRYIASVSLRSKPVFTDLEYDFDGSRNHQAAVREAVLARWGTPVHDSSWTAAEAARVLLRPDGTRNEAEVKRLLSEQDQRPISIVE